MVVYIKCSELMAGFPSLGAKKISAEVTLPVRSYQELGSVSPCFKTLIINCTITKMQQLNFN
jgi:hypothetical protein